MVEFWTVCSKNVTVPFHSHVVPMTSMPYFPPFMSQEMMPLTCRPAASSWDLKMKLPFSSFPFHLHPWEFPRWFCWRHVKPHRFCCSSLGVWWVLWETNRRQNMLPPALSAGMTYETQGSALCWGRVSVPDPRLPFLCVTYFLATTCDWGESSYFIYCLLLCSYIFEWFYWNKTYIT